MTTQPADEATTDLAAVLAVHEIYYGEGEDPDDLNGAYCECGRWRNIEHRQVDVLVSAHRTHVAEALAPIVRQQRAAALDIVERRVEAWIRHGESVPTDVTDYDRRIVHDELRMLASDARAEAERGES